MALIGGGSTYTAFGGGPYTVFNYATSANSNQMSFYNQPRVGELRNIFSAVGWDAKSGKPVGYLHPVSWLMPWKAGGMSSHNRTDINFSDVAELVGGRNGEGSTSITFTADAIGGLVTFGIGTATVTFDAEGELIAVASGNGTATMTFSEVANGSALAWIMAQAVATFTPVAQSYAIGYMEGTSTNENEFSADNLARAVWDALAASYDAPGTMGEKMNSAGSAGNPWTEVIEDGMSAAEILRVIAAVLAGEVSGAGTGTETFKGIDGTTDRVVSTVDNDGNRTAVVVDGS